MFDKIVNKINNIKEENKKYDELFNNSTTFIDFTPLPNLEHIETNKSISPIIDNCPDLNAEKATIINKVIPIEETYLDVLYAKEIKTNNIYWIIPTNKKIWLINEKNYGIIPYNYITRSNIIKNNLMSKIIEINNIILEINGNDNKINNFISIMTDNNIRDNIILQKTKYLCGITPIYQLINEIYTGLSIDLNNNIVFHSKEKNYKINKTDLLDYEVLIDNNCILSKNQERKTSINAFKDGCYSIVLKITTNNNTFTLPILEQNTFGTKYSVHDKIYITNMNFAKKIITKLNEICKEY